MLSEKKLNIMLAKLLSDGRLKYPRATIEGNTYLALIQLSLETKIDLLKEILKG